MQTILKIEHVERLVDKDGIPFYRTHAITKDGTECIGFSRHSKEFDLGDKVEVFLHKNVIKMRHNKSEPNRMELEQA